MAVRTSCCDCCPICFEIGTRTRLQIESVGASSKGVDTWLGSFAWSISTALCRTYCNIWYFVDEGTLYVPAAHQFSINYGCIHG